MCGGGVRKGTMSLAWLLPSFQSLPLPPTSDLGPSGADSWLGGFVYVLEPRGSLQWTLLWDWEFLPPSQPPQVFTFRGFEAPPPYTRTLSHVVFLAPQLFWFICTWMWNHLHMYVEAKHIYLCLHLDWKSKLLIFQPQPLIQNVNNEEIK